MSISLPPYRPIKRRSGFAVMMAALHALIMREIQTRFGSYRLGYLWAPLEVVLQVLIYLVIFGAIMQRVLPGMDYSLFLLAGIIPFYMFQKNATRALGAIKTNTHNSNQYFSIFVGRVPIEANTSQAVAVAASVIINL